MTEDQAPEWLLKLENRRQMIRPRLGHEIGQGAPCSVCGDGCPGLDLHFWRKLCKNCKCRKENHQIEDDDLAGWAQFEILGAIRSKPAYLTISKFAEEPVKVDWIPPNVSVDIAADYMHQLGPEMVPVAGSDAAARRKQQLEYQVPAHDMDPSLCHNLSPTEAEQLQQYVNKLKEVAGQGDVVRLGNMTTRPITPKVVRDRIVQQLSGSEALQNVLKTPQALVGKKVKVFETPMLPDFYDKPVLSDKIKSKLGAMKMNSEVVKSVVDNLPYYDSLLSSLKDREVDIEDDKILGPIDKFYNEFHGNERFQKEVNAFVQALPSPFKQEGHVEQVKSKSPDFNSPLPVKTAKYPMAQHQETPARKLNFVKRPITSLDDVLDPRTGQIVLPSVMKDRVLYDILNSEIIKNALHNPAHTSSTPLIVSPRAMIPDFIGTNLSDPAIDMLESMKLNTKGVQSGVEHGDVYDNLFENLDKRWIKYSFDPVLQPIRELREELGQNPLFREEIVSFVETLPHFANSEEIVHPAPAFSRNLSPEHKIVPSHSNDSGFDSVPPTPNYATYPGVLSPADKPGTPTDIAQKMGELSVSPAKLVVAKCKECKLDIFTGEVAVKADRAGQEVVWHPQCFKCFKCQELLADLVYFFHGGNVYCGRDLALILKIPRCSACDELIFTKEYTAAEGQTFHIKHFCCYNCDAPLAGKQYIPDEKSNMPLCLPCYDQFFAAKCNKCKTTIAPQEQGVSWGQIHWHGQCFLCAGVNCGKSLIGGRFCVKNEQPFCSPACVRSVIAI